MKVRMLVQVSGTHDGKEWPAPGDVVDLPDVEAHSLVEGGTAELVETKAEAKKADAEAKKDEAAEAKKAEHEVKRAAGK